MNSIEKLILCSVVAVAVIALYFINGNWASQIERQAAANKEVFAACKNIADKAHGIFSSNNEIAVMEECLIQRDPAYAEARMSNMCRDAKMSGAKQEAFSFDFRRRCFGNGYKVSNDS